MSFIIKDLSYIHTDKEILFSHLHLSINSGDKIALTGNNGCGKSTLMRILAGDLSPSSGTVLRPEHLYYVPQHFGQYDRQTIAQALGISHKLSALHAILSGDATEKHFNTLNDDWNVEERAQTSLDSWGLDGIPLSRPMEGLSGGEKTRIFLAGMELHNPTAILLDEPTNHLDADGRERLYNLIRRTSATVLVISHDRTLLNQLPAICELSSQGLTYYSGNYDFYKKQKALQQKALTQQLEEKQKALRLARKVAREVEERKAKQNVRGEKTPLKGDSPHHDGSTEKQCGKQQQQTQQHSYGENGKIAGRNVRHQKFTATDRQTENRLQCLSSACGESSGQGKGRQLSLSQPRGFSYGDNPSGGSKGALVFLPHLPAKKRRPPQPERKKRQWKNNPAETHHGRIAPHRRSDGACRLHLRLSGPRILPRP